MSPFFPVSLVELEQLISTALALELRFMPLFPWFSGLQTNWIMLLAFLDLWLTRQQVVGFLSLHNYASKWLSFRKQGAELWYQQITPIPPEISIWHPSMDKSLCGSCRIQPQTPRNPGEPHSWIHWVIGVKTSVLAVDPAVAQGPASAPLSCSPGAPEERCLRLSHRDWRSLRESPRTREEAPAHHWILDTAEGARGRA